MHFAFMAITALIATTIALESTRPCSFDMINANKCNGDTIGIPSQPYKLSWNGDACAQGKICIYLETQTVKPSSQGPGKYGRQALPITDPSVGIKCSGEKGIAGGSLEFDARNFMGRKLYSYDGGVNHTVDETLKYRIWYSHCVPPTTVPDCDFGESGDFCIKENTIRPLRPTDGPDWHDQTKGCPI